MTTTVKKPHLNLRLTDFEGDTVVLVNVNWGTKVNNVFTATNFSTHTAQLRVKYYQEDTTALLTLTESTGVVLNGTPNNLYAALTPVQSATLGDGSFYFELEITNTLTGEVRTYVTGTFTLEP